METGSSNDHKLVLKVKEFRLSCLSDAKKCEIEVDNVDIGDIGRRTRRTGFDLDTSQPSYLLSHEPAGT